MTTESESIEATLRRRRIVFARFVARMEDTRLLKCVMFGELLGAAGRGPRGGAGQNSGWGASWTTSQSFRHQGREVDDCSPGRGEMAQDGGITDGTFHGEMDRCRQIRGWTTACSSMCDRDEKDQGEGSPNKRARDGLFASVVSSVRLIGRCHAVFPWYYVCFVMFRFHVFGFTGSAALRSVVLRSSICMRLDSYSSCSFFEDVAFSEYFCTITVFSLHEEYAVRFPFYLVTTGGWVLCIS